MLIASFMLVISMAAMIQFAVFTWRACLLQVASKPLVNEAQMSASLSHNLLKSNDFSEVTSYQELCPELGSMDAQNLRSVRVYYRLLQFLRTAGAAILPIQSDWTNREMALCVRYASVVLSQRMERNQALLAEVRSY